MRKEWGMGLPGMQIPMLDSVADVGPSEDLDGRLLVSYGG